MVARIYKPAKNAMQSGRANTQHWVLEFEPRSGKRIDPLMGWTGSSDTQAQVKLTFNSETEAIAYANSHNLTYQLIEPRLRELKIRSYAENFR